MMEKRALNSSGFTVVELILVVGMLAIMAVFGVPQLKDHLTNMKAKAAARDIYSALQTAKIEAVRENETVVIEFTTGAFSHDGAVGEYRLFVDDGSGGATAEDLSQGGSEASLMTVTMPKKVSLTDATFTGGSMVGFTGQGLPFNSHSGQVEVRTSKRWYRITLSVGGNINMQKSNDGTNWS